MALNPPVPQPQFTNRFSTGVSPMIGDASGETSTIPAHIRSTCAPAKIGKISSAAGDLVFDDVQRAALSVGVERVPARARHEFALVRLAHVDVDACSTSARSCGPVRGPPRPVPAADSSGLADRSRPSPRAPKSARPPRARRASPRFARATSGAPQRSRPPRRSRSPRSPAAGRRRGRSRPARRRRPPRRAARSRPGAAASRPAPGSARPGSMLTIGQKAFTSAGVSHSESTPLRRFAYMRRVASRTSVRLCASPSTPRWSNRIS